MTIALTPLSGPLKPYLWMMEAAGFALACGSCAVIGWEIRDRDFQKHLKQDATQAERASEAARKMDQQGVVTALGIRNEGDIRKTQIQTTTQTIIKRIPVYVPTPAPDLRDPAPTVTVGFGRLLDYAALGVMPPDAPSSGEPLGASSGIGMPALAQSVVTNYGLCHGYKSEALSWRDWYGKEQALWLVQGPKQ